MSRPLLALVLHANQYLVARRYENREGIDQLADAYCRVLAWHADLGVPLSLHLSGTLIECAAWFRPDLLAQVRQLAERGLVEVVGGSYGENVMPLFPPEVNQRQCREHLWLLRRHLKTVRPRTFWVPERVWETPALAPVLTDPTLPHGGYRQVVLDDRHLGATPGSPGYWASVGRPWRIDGAPRLLAVAIAEPLRYAIPPRDAAAERALETAIAEAAGAPGRPRRLLVFGDDLERVAGAGPWSPDHAAAYRRFLEWLARGGAARPVCLSAGVAAVPAGPERPVRSGGYRELEEAGAGPDYRGWWGAPRWRECRRQLEGSLAALLAAEPASPSVSSSPQGASLVELAWKHLLATSYETAWHTANGHGPEPAPWAVALAHQSRSVLDLLALDRALGPASAPAVRPLPPGDGAEDGAWMLGDGRLRALVAPRRGGRIVLLAGRARERSVLLVGTPTDDWNWQREPHRYMDRPANHPGALADRGRAHDRWEARAAAGASAPVLVLENVEAESPLRGARKLLAVDPEGAVEVEYRLPAGAGEVVVDCALAPDYHRLLRDGRSALQPFQIGRRRGARAAGVAAWVELPPESGAAFTAPHHEAAHSLGVALRSQASRFRFRLGGGEA